MKKCLTLLAATVLTGMTFASFAAPPNTSPATGPLQASEPCRLPARQA